MIKRFYQSQFRRNLRNIPVVKNAKQVLALCLFLCMGQTGLMAQQSCTIECPGDLTFTCKQAVTYTVNILGDCAVADTNGYYSIPDTTVDVADTSISCGPDAANHYFQVYTGFNDYHVANYARVGIVSTWADNGATLTVRLYSLTSTTLPYDVSSANRTLLGTSPAYAIPNGSGGKRVSVPLGGIEIPAGTTLLIEVESSTESVVSTFESTGEFTWLASDSCDISADEPVSFESLEHAYDADIVLYATIPAATINQTAGLASGSVFPLDTTTNTFELVSPDGEVIGECSFNVIIEHESAPVTATADPNPVCIGSQVQFDVTEGEAYAWTGPVGFTANIQNPVINQAATSNGGTYNVTVTDVNGCTATTTVSLSVFAAVTATATATPAGVCAGATVELKATGGVSYAWSGPNGFASTLQNPSLTNTNLSHNGIYTVIVTSADGCTAKASAEVVINPVPVTIINADRNPVCNNVSTKLHGNGASKYVWSTGETKDAIDINPALNTTYTVTGSVGNCTSTASIVITVNAAPTITINPATIDICVNDTITLTANGGSFYNWLGGENTKSIKVSPRETTTYTVNGTAANGCVNKATATVTVKDFEASLTATKADICEGETITLSATGGTAYSWTPGNLSGSNVNVRPTVPTTYKVRITGANGCVKTLEAFIDVHPKPIVYINDIKSVSPPPVCPGTEVDLRAGGAYSYMWAPDNIPGRLITVAPNTTTRYTVTGSNIWGCTSTASINVPVFAPTSARIESSTGKDPICKGQEVTLTAVGLTKPVWWPGKQTTNSIVIVPKDIVYAEVTGFDANGCQVTLVFEARTIYCKPPGLQKEGSADRALALDNAVAVSPNPVSETAYFRFETPTTERYQLNVFSTDGRLVRSEVIAEGTTVQEFSKQNLVKGIYFYQINTTQGATQFNGKIVVIE